VQTAGRINSTFTPFLDTQDGRSALFCVFLCLIYRSLDSVDRLPFVQLPTYHHLFFGFSIMGCWSHRRPHVEVRPEQKWDYIVSR